MYLKFESAWNLVNTLQRSKDQDTLWLLYIADTHAADLTELFAVASEAGVKFCGGLFPGLISEGRVHNDGLIARPQAPGSQLVTVQLSSQAPLWQSQPPVLDRKTYCARVFVDCRSHGIVDFMDDLFDRFGNEITYAGGGAGYRDLRDSSSIFTEQGFIDHGALIILSQHKSLINIKHGWSRIAGPFIATKTKGRVIQEINWEPAGSFYRQQVEAVAPELEGQAIFPTIGSRFPLSIGKQSAEDVVRDPIEVNQDDELIVLSDVPENSALYLAEGDKNSLIDAARQAVVDLGQPEGYDSCFIFDCYSRSLMMEEDFQSELDVVSESVAAITGAPIEGVLVFGEVCGNGKSSLEFYNKTFVIKLTQQ